MSRGKRGSFKAPPRSSRTRNKRTWRGDESEEEGEEDAVQIFKWSQQPERVVEGIRNIYNLQSLQGSNQECHQGILTDVALVSSDGKWVEAHKLVLSLCSPYFKDLFMKMNQNGSSSRIRDASVVVLGNVSGSQLQHLIQFIYTGEAAVTSEEAEDFTRLGDLFQIDGISSSSSRRPPPSKSQSSPFKDNQSKLITVRVINEKNATSPNRPTSTNISEPPVSSDNFPCKTEPTDGVTFDDDNMMDRISNFSDDLNLDHPPTPEDDDLSDPDYLDEHSGLKIPKKRGRPSKSQLDRNRIYEEPPPLRRRKDTSQGNDWKLLEPLSEETLKKDWRQRSQTQFKSNLCIFYYCAYGVKCPASLKVKKFTDGTDVYFHNQKEHANHRTESHGLTPDQKAFVLECLEKKIFLPNDILLQFQVKGFQKPSKSKLSNMLQVYRRKFPSKYTPPETPLKWPRRIRPKKGISSAAPRISGKRGRPRKPEPEVFQKYSRHSSAGTPENPGTSSNHQVLESSTELEESRGAHSHQSTSASHIHHPNHFPTALPFPYPLQPQIALAAHTSSASLQHMSSSPAGYSFLHPGPGHQNS